MAGARPPFVYPIPRSSRLYRLGYHGPGGVAPSPPETFFARTVSNFGDWWMFDGDEWMFTATDAWSRIRSGVFRVPPGVRSLSGHFITPEDSTPIAVFFSAEAYSETEDLRVFVRALVDGVLIEPNDIALTFGVNSSLPVEETRTFIFTGTVDKGLHTVEFEWHVDSGGTGYLRDAAFLIRQGDADGSICVVTPESGQSVSTRNTSWDVVPGLTCSIEAAGGESLAISVSAECYTTGGANLVLRALVDGLPANPADVLFANGEKPQSRMMTFGLPAVAAGMHNVQIQWAATGGSGGEIFMGDRSLVVAATPATDPSIAQVFVSPASGPSVATDSMSFNTVPGLSAIGPLPHKAEIAVLFSGELIVPDQEKVHMQLVLDGNPIPGSSVQIGHDDALLGVQSHIFPAKTLYSNINSTPPPTSTITLEWRVESGATAQLGDRSMTILVKPPTEPDLIEPPSFGLTNTKIEAARGTRKVLVILFDPARPGNPAPDVNVIQDRMWAPADSAQDYFDTVSLGRYQIANALPGREVIGWLSATNSWTNYFGNTPGCNTSPAEWELRWREAITTASQSFDFSSCDINGDGVLNPAMELAILIVIPDSGTADSKVRRPSSAACGNLVIQGVAIPWIAEWLTDMSWASEHIIAIHELAHLMLNLDDIYMSTSSDTYAYTFALMERLQTSTHRPHISGPNKLALGWLNPTVATTDGSFNLADTKSTGEAIILPRIPGKALDEFYLLENRQDAGSSLLYDQNILDSGIALWHVVEGDSQVPPAGDNGTPPACMSVGTWSSATGNGNSRRGIRLTRPSINFAINRHLWESSEYDIHDTGVICSGDDKQNALMWADGEPSGYVILNWSASGPNMSFDLVGP
jgi:M6 family metalloprotease-like protein